jgi:hypothetical protein
MRDKELCSANSCNTTNSCTDYASQRCGEKRADVRQQQEFTFETIKGVNPKQDHVRQEKINLVGGRCIQVERIVYVSGENPSSAVMWDGELLSESALEYTLRNLVGARSVCSGNAVEGPVVNGVRDNNRNAFEAPVVSDVRDSTSMNCETNGSETDADDQERLLLLERLLRRFTLSEELLHDTLRTAVRCEDWGVVQRLLNTVDVTWLDLHDRSSLLHSLRYPDRASVLLMAASLEACYVTPFLRCCVAVGVSAHQRQLEVRAHACRL